MIRLSREMLLAYIENLPIGSILFSSDFAIQAWNPAAGRIFGYDKEDVLCRSGRELLVPPDLHHEVDMLWLQLLSGKAELRYTMENLTSDRRRILCRWTNSLLLEGDGSIKGIIAVVEDVSEQKKARELLIQNEKMTMIGGLAAGMAHEINNPLGIITQDIQNIERRVSLELAANRHVADEIGIELEKVREYLQNREIFTFIQRIKQAVLRSSRIIGNMLQFSRMGDSSPQLASLNEVIRHTIELAASDYDLRKKYDFKSITLTLLLEETLPHLLICIPEIEQVLLNLLKNAAQAMTGQEGAREIRIRTFRENAMAVIRIADTGPGIPETIVQKIFEPFFTTKEIGEGTGLGLSVSHSLITANHHGELTVESSPGNGTCFIIRLPLPAAH